MLKKLGKYDVIEELGKGAMGVVYKGYDSMMARYVALKTMSYSGAPEPEFKKRFYKEAQAPGRLHHENIVIIYELSEDQGVPFIAMEYLEGSDLHGMMLSNHIFTLKKIVDIMVQICDGLHFAHQNGIIHRDVKPANVFILRDGKAKIVDFGIAQISQASVMTKTGMLLGTPSYMSPEQIRCDAVSGRSDQFSVGVILYELLTARRPFDGDTYTTIMYKILHELPPPVRDFYPSCPDELDAIVRKALSKNPDDRFADLAAMARRLRKMDLEMAHDMSLEPTIAVTKPGREDQSLKIEIIQKYLKDGKFDLAARVLDKLKASGESQEILDAIRSEIQEKQRLLRLEELLAEGANFFEDEHYDLALECFSEALAMDAENPRALDWVRRAHQKESEKRLRQSIDQLLEKGDRALHQGDVDGAIRLFNEAVKLNPSSRETADRLREAQKTKERRSKEEECKSLVQQARTFFKQGKIDDARTLCRKVTEILPEYDEAKTLLEDVEKQEKEATVQKALKDLEALVLKKRYSEALATAGNAIQKAGLDPRITAHVRRIRWVRRRLWAVPSGLAFVAAVVAAVWLFVAPSPKPVPLPPPQGFLSMDIRPYALVTKITELKSGKPVQAGRGVTPLRAPLPPGKYRVEYQNRNLSPETYSVEVDVESGKEFIVSRTLPGFNSRSAIDEILKLEVKP